MKFEKLFMESKGQPILYNGKELKMVDRISLDSNSLQLQLEFLSVNSKWKQGIVLQTKGVFEINERKLSTKIILWYHAAPKQVNIKINSKR